MELLVVDLINEEENSGAALCSRLNEIGAFDAGQKNGLERMPLWSWTMSSDEESLRCTAHLPQFRLAEHGEQLYGGAARILADYIVEKHEPDIIRQIIRKQFRYSREEEAAIERCCRMVLSGEQWGLAEEESYSNEQGGSRRSIKVATELLDYMTENTHLHLQGFLTFRLHSYWQELREAAEYAVEEYVMDKQYQEFISLLKYFVAAQPNRRGLVHVLHGADRSIQLLDEQFEPLDMKGEERALAELVDAELNMEDMVLSNLITAAPASILIHTSEPEHQVIRTIQAIFDSRIDICGGCSDCQMPRREVLGGSGES
ncbi:putative sporulation protein YtxC [Paenibacillus herberti]|uniref:Sporulation protein n=1 Tax=Paenibacillus herberti TaxID=1619309 RepID=A0A229NT12_9BACL|nr:putative sporulation protein YtxC [Paenibacillus herberti]OXM13028.1 sporulation protein [Paenibacillus herberti]